MRKTRFSIFNTDDWNVLFHCCYNQNNEACANRLWITLKIREFITLTMKKSLFKNKKKFASRIWMTCKIRNFDCCNNEKLRYQQSKNKFCKSSILFSKMKVLRRNIWHNQIKSFWQRDIFCNCWLTIRNCNFHCCTDLIWFYQIFLFNCRIAWWNIVIFGVKLLFWLDARPLLLLGCPKALKVIIWFLSCAHRAKSAV
jgi:hypothetical protein